jgi:hypothetical protein
LLLTKLTSEKAKFILAGDYNINILNHDTHCGSEKFLNNIFAHMCLPAITKPTRFSASSSTLIDNIIYNMPAQFGDAKSGLIISDISDHLPIFHLSDYCIGDTVMMGSRVPNITLCRIKGNFP